jgi:hypothetical protein
MPGRVPGRKVGACRRSPAAPYHFDRPPIKGDGCRAGAGQPTSDPTRLLSPHRTRSRLANYRVRLPLPRKGSGLASLQSSTSNA